MADTSENQNSTLISALVTQIRQMVRRTTRKEALAVLQKLITEIFIPRITKKISGGKWFTTLFPPSRLAEIILEEMKGDTGGTEVWYNSLDEDEKSELFLNLPREKIVEVWLQTLSGTDKLALSNVGKIKVGVFDSLEKIKESDLKNEIFGFAVENFRDDIKLGFTSVPRQHHHFAYTAYVKHLFNATVQTHSGLVGGAMLWWCKDLIKDLNTKLHTTLLNNPSSFSEAVFHGVDAFVNDKKELEWALTAFYYNHFPDESEYLQNKLSKEK